MRLFRWRLWALMGLVLVVALGIKAVLLTRPKHDFVRDRLRTGAGRDPLPRTPEVEAALVAALGYPEPWVRHYALWGLGQIGSTNPAMIPRLIEELEATTWNLYVGNLRHNSYQVGSVQVLKRFQIPAAVIAPRLRTAMASPDWYVRSGALAILDDAADRPRNPTDSTLVSLLLAGLSDTDPTNRFQAIKTLVRLGSGTRQRAVAILLDQLRGPDSPSRLLAAIGLSRFHREGRAAVPLLVDRLNSENLQTRLANLGLLGQLGPKAKPAVPAIVRAMLAPDSKKSVYPCFREFFPPQSRNWEPDRWTNLGVLPSEIGLPFATTLGSLGAAVLGKIGPEADQEATAILIGMLRSGDEPRRLAAADVIVELGTRASAAFPTLLALAEATEPPPQAGWLTMDRIIQALWRVVPGDDPRLVGTLIRLLESSDPNKRSAAAGALSGLEPPPTAAVPPLIRALSNESQSIRFSAAVALGHYPGPTERAAAIPPLLATLRDPDDGVRFHAAQSLAQFGAGASDVIPVAIALLANENRAYRCGGVEILGKYGPAAAPAIPALRAFRSNPVELDRDVAEKALKLIEPAGAIPSQ